MVVRQQDEVDRIFGALADATRRDIVARVLKQEASVSALADRYAMSFAAVQKHVAVLGLRARVPGDGRQVATVRRDVQADLRGAQRAVAAGRRSGRPVDDLARLTARLADQVRDLDTDLAVVASETDRDRRARLLAERQPQVAALRRACDQVREGVLLTTTPTHAPLAQEIEDEVLRLRLRASAYRELTGRP